MRLRVAWNGTEAKSDSSIEGKQMGIEVENKLQSRSNEIEVSWNRLKHYVIKYTPANGSTVSSFSRDAAHMAPRVTSSFSRNSRHCRGDDITMMEWGMTSLRCNVMDNDITVM